MRRRVLIIATCVVLGALINVGVAWVGTAVTPLLMNNHTRTPPDGIGEPHLGRWKASLGSLLAEPNMLAAGGNSVVDRAWISGYEYSVGPAVHMEVENWIPTEWEPHHVKSASIFHTRAGFPFRSLEYIDARFGEANAMRPVPSWGSLRVGQSARVEQSILDSPFSLRDDNVELLGRTFVLSALPRKPIPAGFAANTAVYAAPFLLVAVVVPWVRHRRCVRRGWCLGCGYDLAGLNSCPECGRHSEESE